MGRIWKVLTRKKAIDPVSAEETRLSRVLNTFDLTALGVGSTLGVGVYVLAGQVAKDTAGPSVILSFLIAAIASVFAGLCYAEFGARTPKAGSAYIYSYVCVGEFIAFVIGWNLILEYVIGSASVARGLSLYLDTLINNTLQDTFREIAPINVAYLSEYFDFFSFGISVLLSVALAFGLRESSMINNIVTGLNLLVVLFVIIAGSLKADPKNWHVNPNNTSNATNVGNGGFFPFGVEGMIKGAATCFYGFIGFDCIATTGEEVKNPRKAIPISIIVSLFIIFLAYFGTSTVLTLMVPYYLQDHDAPIPRAFEEIGWYWAKWIVAIGALFGLCASLFGAMFPLPRIIYAMGSDGLVFRFLAKVSVRFQTPVVGTLLAGVLTGLMAALFDLSQLVNMMSIGTLLAYTIVAASVLLLRYKEEVKKVYVPIKTSSDTDSTSSESTVDDGYNDDGIRQNFDGPSTSDEQELITGDSVTCCRSLKYIFNFVAKEPNRITENIVAVEVFLYCILCVAVGICAIYLNDPIMNGQVWAISITSVVVGLTVLLMVSLVSQPTSKKELSFKVPFVPLIPALSILVNIYLMLMLDYMTWIRFAVWMAIGIPMYCMRACVHKPSQTPHYGQKYTNNITNGHANGISNPTFVHTETSENEMKEKSTKKKAMAPPPPVTDQKQSIEVQQEAVIAQLDEILDKEVAIAQLDDVLNNATLRISDRKMSAGSLSDMSAVVSRFEDVVADVHCADVSTPIANPKNSPIPSVCDNPNVPNNVVSESVKVLGNDNKDISEFGEGEWPSSPIESAKSDENEVKLESREEIIDNINNNKSPDVYAGTENVENDDKPLEKDILPASALQQGMDAVLNSSIASNAYSDEQKNENIEAAQIFYFPIPASDETNDSPKASSVSFTELAEKIEVEPAVSSPVPTKEALKSVTLRHVKKQIKNIETDKNVNASEDNLKVGSEEYKNFIKSLDNKLKRMTVVPSLYQLPRKDIIVKQPQEVTPNENVIEDHINQEDAKEKLKIFIESTMQGDHEPVRDNNPRRLLKEEDRSKSVDDSLLEGNLNNSEVVSEAIGKTTNDVEALKFSINPKGSLSDKTEAKVPPNDLGNGLSDHRQRMEDVFHSIRFKKLEAKGDEHLKRRLSKSLGSSFNKEANKSEHSQKMDGVFKSIMALKSE